MFSKLLIIAIGLWVMVSNGPAQVAAGCPSVTVYGPPGIVLPGEIARYSVRVDPIDNAWPLTYKWSVSAGVIKSGQETSEIEVILPRSSLTVTVEVGGLPQNCPSVSSDTLPCYFGEPVAKKLVEISGVLTSKNLTRIKEAIDKHQDRVNDQFYFIVSGTNQKNSQKRKLTVLKRLFKSDPRRATYVISEKTDDTVTIWIVPPGATPPTP